MASLVRIADQACARVEEPGMSTDKDEEFFGIRRAWTYRKSDPETLRILGLKMTALDQEIQNGNIRPPHPLTAAGRSCGWTGGEIIEIQKARMARAAARQQNPPGSEQAKAQAKARAASASKKKKGRS